MHPYDTKGFAAFRLALGLSVAIIGLSTAWVTATAQTQGNGPAIPQVQPVPLARNANPANVGQFNPTNPAGTTSTTPVMTGLSVGGSAGPCLFTPKYSQNVRVEMYGTLANSVSGDGASARGFFGACVSFAACAAPANGGVQTGTAWSPTVQAVSSAASAPEQFYISGHLTGLTANGPGYWFDVAQAAVTGGTATLTGLQCSFNEE